MKAIPNIDQDWTLFLDRDGVINIWLKGIYIKKWEQFSFEKNALKALKKLSKIFDRIIIVTNQQGIAKGLMTHQDLEIVHRQMLDSIQQSGGRIDAVYYCPYMDGHPCRKPMPGMALSAKKDFPKIDFEKTIMVGDRNSDMKFGRSIGAFTCMVGNHEEVVNHEDIDAVFTNLEEFTLSIA